MTRKAKLTEAEWLRVFKIRCDCKRGAGLGPDERKLIERAMKEDRERYSAMDDDVFDATVPFGSNVRAKR